MVSISHLKNLNYISFISIPCSREKQSKSEDLTIFKNSLAKKLLLLFKLKFKLNFKLNAEQ